MGIASSKAFYSNNISSEKNLNLNYNINNPHFRFVSESNAFFNTSDVFVRKWVESEKYGLGYILSNDNVGVYCNNNTKIIYKPDGTNFIYIEKNEKLFFSPRRKNK